MELDVQLEGLLFYKAAPMKIHAIGKVLGVSVEEVRAAAEALSKRLQVGATRLIVTDTELELVTAPELDMLIESIRREELKRDIGKAGAETLAIVLYKGPVTRADIDRIRGVNSAFIVRNLLVRGLIAREQTGQGNILTVTPALLAHLGIERQTHLPDFGLIRDRLDTFEQQIANEAN